jgi:hypothetical protein
MTELETFSYKFGISEPPLVPSRSVLPILRVAHAVRGVADEIRALRNLRDAEEAARYRAAFQGYCARKESPGRKAFVMNCHIDNHNVRVLREDDDNLKFLGVSIVHRGDRRWGMRVRFNEFQERIEGPSANQRTTFHIEWQDKLAVGFMQVERSTELPATLLVSSNENELTDRLAIVEEANPEFVLRTEPLNQTDFAVVGQRIESVARMVFPEAA